MSIQTISITKGSILSINAVLNIPVGTEMDIANESILHNVYLQESDTQPPASAVNKRSLTQRDWASSEAYIPSGSEELWVWSPFGDVIISVQVL